MKMLTVLVLLLGLLAGGMVVVKPAEAVCAATIYAERAYTNGATTQVFGRIGSLSPEVFYWTTTNATFASLIFNAVAQRNRLLIYGNATSCPTSGTVRSGGVVTQIYQQP